MILAKFILFLFFTLAVLLILDKIYRQGIRCLFFHDMPERDEHGFRKCRRVGCGQWDWQTRFNVIGTEELQDDQDN